MRLFVLPFVILMISLFTLAATISAASNLEISSRSDFSILSTNFSGGQTIFIRLESSLPSTASSKLNIRDNHYNFVNSFDLKKNGNYFSAIIPTPYGEGYYSLEAVVKKDDSNTTSVKTIKVGNPTSANVKVNVDSSVSGSKVLGESAADNVVIEPSPVEDTIEVYKANDSDILIEDASRGFGQHIVSIIREIADFLWPF